MEPDVPLRPQVIHLASGNRHKAEEFQRLANESGLTLLINSRAIVIRSATCQRQYHPDYH